MTEQQRIEELMKPRYKVIADYPGNILGVGHTLKYIPLIHFRSPESEWEKFYIKYPHLFKRLEWWEDRKPEEMPEYVKYAGEGGRVAKARFDLESTSCWFMFLDEETHPYSPGGSALENTNWIPATLAEYTQYINSKK